MSRERLRQLEDIAQLQRLRLDRAQLRAAGLRRDLQSAHYACELAATERGRIDAQWRAALARSDALDLAAVAGWRSLAGDAQRRCEQCEAERQRAQDAVDAFARELLRVRTQSERAADDAARERAAVARKREEKTADAVLERHNAIGAAP
ncbi:hypothetical protein ACI2IY_03630 [Lysobacter enzymogenes]|uniref:hypothetical protein n=1 Tax=Lysobacter enzymogenes TaxID=69 RepID=UPI00384DC9A2